MLGEAVEWCQAQRPGTTRPTLASAKSTRSSRDGAAKAVERRCATEESPVHRRVPCSTPYGAATDIAVFMKLSTWSGNLRDFRTE